jgi:hypothetical protein
MWFHVYYTGFRVSRRECQHGYLVLSTMQHVFPLKKIQQTQSDIQFLESDFRSVLSLAFVCSPTLPHGPLTQKYPHYRAPS